MNQLEIIAEEKRNPIKQSTYNLRVELFVY